jgi:hypothetical protein
VGFPLDVLEIIIYDALINSAGGREKRRLLALASKERLVKILEKMLDENEFLSEHGVRS